MKEPVPGLVLYLAQVVRRQCVPQCELARRTGFSEKHISQMMRRGVGSVQGWDALLLASGVRYNDQGIDRTDPWAEDGVAVMAGKFAPYVEPDDGTAW